MKHVKIQLDIDYITELFIQEWNKLDKTHDYTDLMRVHYRALIECGCFEDNEHTIEEIVKSDYNDGFFAMYSPEEKGNMLDDYNCSSIKELKDKNIIITECEYGWVCFD